jgi:hypothetical protein
MLTYNNYIENKLNKNLEYYIGLTKKIVDHIIQLKTGEAFTITDINLFIKYLITYSEKFIALHDTTKSIEDVLKKITYIENDIAQNRINFFTIFNENNTITNFKKEILYNDSYKLTNPSDLIADSREYFDGSLNDFDGSKSINELSLRTDVNDIVNQSFQVIQENFILLFKDLDLLNRNLQSIISYKKSFPIDIIALNLVIILLITIIGYAIYKRIQSTTNAGAQLKELIANESVLKTIFDKGTPSDEDKPKIDKIYESLHKIASSSTTNETDKNFVKQYNEILEKTNNTNIYEKKFYNDNTAAVFNTNKKKLSLLSTHMISINNLSEIYYSDFILSIILILVLIFLISITINSYLNI